MCRRFDLSSPDFFLDPSLKNETAMIIAISALHGVGQFNNNGIRHQGGKHVKIGVVEEKIAERTEVSQKRGTTIYRCFATNIELT